MKPLRAVFYRRDAVAVARGLIGALIVRELDGERLVGRVVEAEAYGRDDPASHAFRGPTERNRAMFGEPGHAYVYLSHGVHHCLNAVALPGTAVLIRALEPLAGLEAMADRRGVDDMRLLCAGPGRLCRALGIDRGLDGHDLTAGDGLWIAGGEPPAGIVATPRIGVTRAAERPWRFVERASRFASRPVRSGRGRAGASGSR